MTHHLSPQEFVESLDGVLGTDRLDHLHACAECRADLDRLRSVVVEVQAAEMPEPSPLFWNHFSERVRQATAAAPTPVAASWWSAAWRPVVGVAAGLAVVILPVLLWPRSGPVALAPPVESVARVSPEAPAEPLAVDDAPWDLFREPRQRALVRGCAAGRGTAVRHRRRHDRAVDAVGTRSARANDPRRNWRR